MPSPDTGSTTILSIRQKLRSLKFRAVARSWFILLAALTCLALGGFHLMYQLFFIGQGLEDLSAGRTERLYTPFAYDDVQWFRGTSVSRNGEPVAFDVRATPALANAKARLDVFVQVNLQDDDLDTSGDLGTLRITHQYKNRITTYDEPLTERQQRFSMPYEACSPRRSQKDWRENAPTVTSFQLLASDDSPIESVLVGTKLRVSRMGPVITWLLAALALLVVWTWAGRRLSSKLLWLLAGTFLVLLLFRCGAFISNDFFLETSGRASVFKTSFGHTRRFLGTGEFNPWVYKRVGHFVVPAMTMVLDRGARQMSLAYYIETWPTPRYIWFILESIGLLVLTASTFRYLSRGAALLLPLVYVTFPPILFDMYNMEDDALLILAMLLMTALLLKVSAAGRATRFDLVAFAFLMLGMIASKITVAFMVPLIPAAFLFARWINRGGLSLKQCAMVFAALVIGFGSGQVLAKNFGPAVREAQPGYRYQGHNLWDMMWAANGLYDRESAHPFVKQGRARDQAVADAIAVDEERSVNDIFGEDISRLRHSAAGDELVYRPQLQAAWSERPSYFLNHQLIRFWNHGLLFYGYPDRGRYWRMNLTTKSPDLPIGQEELQNTKKGKDRLGNRGHKTIVRRSRFDPVWKIAPQILVVSLFNFDRPDDRMINLLLTMLALLGVITMRRVDLAAIFIGCVLVKIVFNTFIHGKVRYFDWVHVPMLLGLAMLLTVTISALLEAARRSTVPTIDDG